MSAEQSQLFPRVARAALNKAPVIQLCMPELEEVIEDEREAMIARMLELKPLVAEYHQIRKAVNALMPDGRPVKVGRYTVEPHTFEVPEKIVRAHSVKRLSVI